MGRLIERQTIVTWTDPADRLPADDEFVVVTVSGKFGNVTYDHAMVIANYMEEEGWFFLDSLLERFNEIVTVHAWADLEPYGG